MEHVTTDVLNGHVSFAYRRKRLWRLEIGMPNDVVYTNIGVVMRFFPRKATSLVSSTALLVPTLVTAGLVATVSAPAAVASAPTPLPPTLLWQENFENGTNANPVPLVGGDTGLGSTTYTASTEWANPDLCNGIVLNGQSSGAYQGCVATPAMDNLRLLAGYIGQHNGDYPAGSAVQNHVVAAYTTETPGRQPPQVMAETNQAVTLTPSAQQNRFITASMRIAATSTAWRSWMVNRSM